MGRLLKVVGGILRVLFVKIIFNSQVEYNIYKLHYFWLGIIIKNFIKFKAFLGVKVWRQCTNNSIVSLLF